MLIIMTAPIIHEIIAAGPATLAAVPAPNSHPEPINEFSASITPENNVILCRFNLSMLSLPLASSFE